MPRPKRLSTDWFTDCATPEEHASRRAQLQSAGLTLQLLRDILTHRRSMLDQDKVDYDKPAWQDKLIHNVVRKEEIDRLLKLLDPLTE